MGMPFPNVNGNAYDFSSTEITVRGRKILGGIQNISYEHSLTPGELYGNNAQVIGTTRGKYMATASATFYKAQYQELLDILGDGYGEARFPIVVMYGETGSPLIVDTLAGCRLKKDSDSGTEGGDASLVAVEFHVMMLYRNGKSMISLAKRINV